MSSPPLVLGDRHGAVLRLTLNRASARNALSLELMEALKTELATAAQLPDLHVIVLAADGPTFSSGHDLKEMAAKRSDGDKGRAAYARIFQSCSELMMAIVHHPLPVIAEVQGIATAAGCQLVASCDLAVASSAARFATPGVNIGLFCSTPMVALSRNLSRKHAMAMLLTADMVSAEEALGLGLVNKVLPPELLTTETMALAERIAAKPRATVRTGKEAFYRQLELPLSEAYAYASQVMTKNMLATEAEEGICAFLEKRPPNWPA